MQHPCWSPAPEEIEFAETEIHVFAFRLDLPGSGIESLVRLLSPDETVRAGSFKLKRDMERFVVRRAGTRTILARYLAVEASHLQFRYDSLGKPGLVGDEAAGRLRFNVSAAGGLGVLAVQVGGDLGIDVERVRRFSNALSVAHRFFTQREHAALCRLPKEELDAGFFSLWTRKEALVKCLGRGLSHPLDSFSLAPIPIEPVERVVVEGPVGPETRWVLSLPGPREGFVAALAVEAVPRVVRCFTWTDL